MDIGAADADEDKASRIPHARMGRETYVRVRV
jgi:hypothetical protein